MTKRILLTLLLTLSLGLLAGCKLLEIATNGLASAGVISDDAARVINVANNSAESVAKALKSLTPENEYYIGRAVAATILTDYPVYDNPAATRYVNTLGQMIASVSDKPETYAGYHFLILDLGVFPASAASYGYTGLACDVWVSNTIRTDTLLACKSCIHTSSVPVEQSL